MTSSEPASSEIGRYQLAASATASTATIAVIDTVSGRLWVRQIFTGIGGDKALLKEENYGRPLWDVPR